eukprot:15456192-Alexandrium_andersonii.AAC.1
MDSPCVDAKANESRGLLFFAFSEIQNFAQSSDLRSAPRTLMLGVFATMSAASHAPPPPR